MARLLYVRRLLNFLTVSGYIGSINVCSWRQDTHITRYLNPQEFVDTASPFLLEQEAANNLMIGITGKLCENPTYYAVSETDYPVLCAVKHDETVIAAAAMTPPHNLILTQAPPEAVALVAEEMHRQQIKVPGVQGPKESVTAFIKTWKKLTDAPFKLWKSMRIYQLDEVIPVANVPGHMKVAVEQDLELVTRWYENFAKDTNTHIMRNFLPRFQRGEICLWVNHEPVSMAATTSPTPNGIRIGGVYTPPEHRKHGYASAITAAISQRMLDSGRRFCFLFTDLANPTSNHIYQQIGYRPVCDVEAYGFLSYTNTA